MHQTSTLTKSRTVLLTPRGIVKWLAIIVFILLIANITGILLESVFQFESRFTRILVRYFDFNGEGNIPAFFSSVILLVAALVLFLIHVKKHHLAARQQTNHWLILGLIFVFLAVDENVQLHEHVANFVRPKLGTDLSGLLHWSWVVPYALLTLAVVAYFFRFVLRLPTISRNLILLSGAIFITGALGLELIEGYLYKRYGIDHLYNRIMYCLEELMEMTGVVLLIYALLDFLAGYRMRVAFVPEAKAALSDD